jgi:YidC/Oxa1 family membrane protein insertase
MPKNANILNETNSSTQKTSLQNSDNQSANSAPESIQTSSTSATKAPDSIKESKKSAETNDVIASVKAKDFSLSIDKLGRIEEFTLNGKKYTDDEGNHLAVISKSAEVRPLEIRFSDAKLNEEAFEVPYNVDKKTLDLQSGKGGSIVLTQKLSQLTVKKILSFKNDGSYSIKVELSEDKEYYITPGYRPDVLADNFTVHGVLVKEPDDTVTIIKDGDATGLESIKGAKIVSAFDRYYSTAFYNFDKGLDVVIIKLKDDNPLAFVKGKKELNIGGYIGPKSIKDLQILTQD